MRNFSASLNIRAGIIGLGVGERHISGYSSDARCKVMALCDVDLKKLTEVHSRNLGAYATVNPQDVLLDPNIDIISIASYDNFHAEQVITAIENGKHVFVEKPICLTRSEFNNIKSCVQAHPGIHLSSNFVLRHVERFRELKERISSGMLGTIYFLEGDYDYGRLSKLTDGWRGVTPGYSVTHGGAIHLIDLLLWATSKNVVEVFAYASKKCTHESSFLGNDLVVSILKFEDDTLAKVTANFASVGPHFHKVACYGSRGTFTQSYNGASYIWSRDPQAPTEISTTAYPDVGRNKQRVLASFVSSILDGSPPAVSVDDVFKVMNISLAIDESIALGRPMKIDNKEYDAK